MRVCVSVSACVSVCACARVSESESVRECVGVLRGCFAWVRAWVRAQTPTGERPRITVIRTLSGITSTC